MSVIDDYLNILKQGVDVWNTWRILNPRNLPFLDGADLRGLELNGSPIGLDFSEAYMSKADLSGSSFKWAWFRKTELVSARFCGANLERAKFLNANLSGADFSHAQLIWSSFEGANLQQAQFYGANLTNAFLPMANLNHAQLSGAQLVGAELRDTDLRYANLSNANLEGAFLLNADLSDANLSNANLNNTDLTNVNLVGANLQGASLIGCRVYGISAWDSNLANTTQAELMITYYDNQLNITVDDLQVAQFIYLMLNNKNIGRVIDTLTSKSVLILGRFKAERKVVLDAIREELKQRNYTPILFDFEKPSSRDLTETVVTLAHMSRFIIADITDPRSIPQELQAIVPNLPSVAVQPIILSTQDEFAMFEHFKRYPWVLPTYKYDTQEALLRALADKIIQPAEDKVKELRGRS